jgi:hypothetical protein
LLGLIFNEFSLVFGQDFLRAERQTILGYLRQSLTLEGLGLGEKGVAGVEEVAQPILDCCRRQREAWLGCGLSKEDSRRLLGSRRGQRRPN